jgi:hypothetical protein
MKKISLILFLLLPSSITFAYNGKSLTGNYYTYFNALNSINYVENYYAELKGRIVLIDKLANDNAQSASINVINYQINLGDLNFSTAQYTVLKKIHSDLPDDKTQSYTLNACKINYDGGTAVYKKDSGVCSISDIENIDGYLLRKTVAGNKYLKVFVRHKYSDPQKKRNYNDTFSITREQLGTNKYKMLAENKIFVPGDGTPNAVVRIDLTCSDCHSKNDKKYDVTIFKKYKDTGFEGLTYSTGQLTTVTGSVEEVTKQQGKERLFHDIAEVVNGRPIVINQYEYSRGYDDPNQNGKNQKNISGMFESVFNQKFHLVGKNFNVCNMKQIADGKMIKIGKRKNGGRWSFTYDFNNKKCKDDTLYQPEGGLTYEYMDSSSLKDDNEEPIDAASAKSFAKFLFDNQSILQTKLKDSPSNNPLDENALDAALKKLQQAVTDYYK